MKKKSLIGLSLAALIVVAGFFAYEARATLSPAPSIIALPMDLDSADADMDRTTISKATHASTEPARVEDSLADHRAYVFQVIGSVKLLKKDSERWRTLKAGMVIEQGDQIRTSAESSARIHYDDYYLNIVQIKENSVAEFQSIEPTRIFITNGEVFSALDGLPQGSSYQVVTPTAVGGVRGTRFIRAFNPVTRQDRTLVSEGTVEVILKDTQYAGKAFKVTGQQTLTFDEHTMSDLGQAEIRPITRKQAVEMDQDFHAMRDALAVAKGGEDKLMEAAQMWEEVQGNHYKVKQLQSQLAASGISQNVTAEGAIVFGTIAGTSTAAVEKEKQEASAESSQPGSNQNLNINPEGQLVNALTGDVENANEVANLNNTFLTAEVDICKQNPSACGK